MYAVKQSRQSPHPEHDPESAAAAPDLVSRICA
jgi:hypothetical protein